MKDIHKVLLDKTSTIKNMPVNSNKLDIDMYSPSCSSFLQGNYWVCSPPYKRPVIGNNIWYLWRVNVNEKCGIELLHWNKDVLPRYQPYKTKEGLLVFRNLKNLQFHLKENLGIDCPENTDYIKMIKLLRTV